MLLRRSIEVRGGDLVKILTGMAREGTGSEDGILRWGCTVADWVKIGVRIGISQPGRSR